MSLQNQHENCFCIKGKKSDLMNLLQMTTNQQIDNLDDFAKRFDFCSLTPSMFIPAKHSEMNCDIDEQTFNMLTLGCTHVRNIHAANLKETSTNKAEFLFCFDSANAPAFGLMKYLIEMFPDVSVVLCYEAENSDKESYVSYSRHKLQSKKAANIDFVNDCVYLPDAVKAKYEEKCSNDTKLFDAIAQYDVHTQLSMICDYFDEFCFHHTFKNIDDYILTLQIRQRNCQYDNYVILNHHDYDTLLFYMHLLCTEYSDVVSDRFTLTDLHQMFQ